MSHQHNKHVPKDAQVIMSLLKDVGINEYEPKVINQLLEFTYRYITCILDDARVFANHAKKKIIDLEDVKLAVNMISDRSFTSPPPRDMLMEVARAKNNIPLPLLKPHCGLRLPPDRYCLSACNYRLKTNKKPQTSSKPNFGPLASSTTSTISSKIQTQTKNQPAISNIVKRTQLTTIARTQSVTIPKPVIKFSSSTSSQQTKTIVKTKPQIPSATGQVQVHVSGDQIKRKREDDEPMDTD